MVMNNLLLFLVALAAINYVQSGILVVRIAEEPPSPLEVKKTYSVNCTISLAHGSDTEGRFPLQWIVDDELLPGAKFRNTSYSEAEWQIFVLTLTFNATYDINNKSILCVGSTAEDTGSISFFRRVITPPSQPRIEGPTAVAKMELYHTWTCSSSGATLTPPKMTWKVVQGGDMKTWVLEKNKTELSNNGELTYDLSQIFTINHILASKVIVLECEVFHRYEQYRHTTANKITIRVLIQRQKKLHSQLVSVPPTPYVGYTNVTFECNLVVHDITLVVEQFPLSWWGNNGIPPNAKIKTRKDQDPVARRYFSTITFKAVPSIHNHDLACIATIANMRGITVHRHSVIFRPETPSLIGSKSVVAGEEETWFCECVGASLVAPYVYFTDTFGKTIKQGTNTMQAAVDAKEGGFSYYAVIGQLDMRLSHEVSPFRLTCFCVQEALGKNYVVNASTLVSVTQPALANTSSQASGNIHKADTLSHGRRCQPEFLTSVWTIFVFLLVKTIVIQLRSA